MASEQPGRLHAMAFDDPGDGFLGFPVPTNQILICPCRAVSASSRCRMEYGGARVSAMKLAESQRARESHLEMRCDGRDGEGDASSEAGLSLHQGIGNREIGK